MPMGAKLIRDKAGDIPWKVEAAKGLIRKPSSTIEMRRLLLQKLFEEVGELAAEYYTGGPESLSSEIADVLEVLDGIIAWQALGNLPARSKRTKYEARGGYDVGAVWDA